MFFNSKIKFVLIALTVSLLFCSNESASAQNKIPRFEDYPSIGTYKGKNAPLKMTREKKRLYGEKLQYTIKNNKVNFAGLYVIASWSCGMWCNWSAIIDAKTGRIYGWNGILSVCFPDLDNDFACNEDFNNVEYRINSKLIVFFGWRNDTGERGFHYYKFENGQFIHLKSIPVKEQRTASEIQLDMFDKKNKDKKP